MFDTSLYNTSEILDLLTLVPDGTDRFIGQSHFMGSPNVFGGQVLGQALHAAAQTVPLRRAHSLHSLFILPGNHRLPIEFEVERVRDGGSFSTRRVVALQEGKRIFVMSASFQDDEVGLSHQKPMPQVPGPDTLPSAIAGWKARAEAGGRQFVQAPADFRVVGGADLYGNPSRDTGKQMWVRAPMPLPDAPLVHEALFAYLSDYSFLVTALQPHGVMLGDPRLQIASLDHTIWFHRPLRMDQWLLLCMDSPNASGGRGLVLASVYDQQGQLVATMAQEGLMRLREKKG
ncbi:acyl-CoA thioesterase II [Actimicrobium sp. CCC2.4]|uniref:acyl-CoA thioesterase n=1 Tax=Actimicrobium sp. CCC2.4 TaxID=3048606 RepID=UPI002AC92AE1|nr:acyl-CoA thioesterase II [Actimicrobium sp. CCC2.4]MEB0133745.1 acyl-CoA thioesterase II [Actimicrobium sp. CCC2.4]WPX31291.1 acyl-CoA thioesterase II [Actimicrobium sp. CCC2.4]